MKNRIEILTDLLNLNSDPKDLQIELHQYPWDSEVSLIVLTKVIFINVIEKATNNNLTFGEIEDWANVIECRDDIEFEDEKVQEYIFELANPILNGKITIERLREILNELL